MKEKGKFSKSKKHPNKVKLAFSFILKIKYHLVFLLHEFKNLCVNKMFSTYYEFEFKKLIFHFRFVFNK